MLQEEVTFNETEKVEASDELKTKIKEFLKQYASIEDAQKVLEEVKSELKELFSKENLKSVSLEDVGFRVECREKNTVTWDEKAIFKIVAPTPYVETVFPIVIDKNKVSDEDLHKAGLYDKCKTRKFDPSAMEKLLTTGVFKLDEFTKQNLLSVESSRQIARVSLAKKETKKKK